MRSRCLEGGMFLACPWNVPPTKALLTTQEFTKIQGKWQNLKNAQFLLSYLKTEGTTEIK